MSKRVSDKNEAAQESQQTLEDLSVDDASQEELKAGAGKEYQHFTVTLTNARQ